MRIQNPFLILSLVLLSNAPLAASSWDTDLPASLDRMAESHWQPSLQVGFGTFTYSFSELPSPFARWLEERLGASLARTKRLKLFNRAAAAAMDPDLKAVYGDFFAKSGLDALLHGRYAEEGSSIRVSAQLTSLADGTLIGAAELVIPRSELPSGLAVAPSVAIQGSADSLKRLVPESAAARTDPLRVSVSTERGARAVYREGEDLVVLVTASKRAWIKVYHVDVAGRVQLIYPNRFDPGRPIEAGNLVRIPGEGQFSFRMTPPFGTEFIKVVASTQPFVSTEADFAELGAAASGARSVITRGLSVVGTTTQEQELAEALASYVIMGRN